MQTNTSMQQNIKKTAGKYANKKTCNKIGKQICKTNMQETM